MKCFYYFNPHYYKAIFKKNYLQNVNKVAQGLLLKWSELIILLGHSLTSRFQEIKVLDENTYWKHVLKWWLEIRHISLHQLHEVSGIMWCFYVHLVLIEIKLHFYLYCDFTKGSLFVFLSTLSFILATNTNYRKVESPSRVINFNGVPFSSTSDILSFHGVLLKAT